MEITNEKTAFLPPSRITDIKTATEPTKMAVIAATENAAKTDDARTPPKMRRMAKRGRPEASSERIKKSLPKRLPRTICMLVSGVVRRMS